MKFFFFFLKEKEAMNTMGKVVTWHLFKVVHSGKFRRNLGHRFAIL